MMKLARRLLPPSLTEIILVQSEKVKKFMKFKIEPGFLL